MYISSLHRTLSIIVVSCFIFLGNTNLQAQLGVFLQIEEVHTEEIVKFVAGDVIEFKTSKDGDWRKERIKKILVDEQVIMFDYDFISLKDFTAMRLINRPVRGMATLLGTFGVAWTAFGLVAGIFTDFEFRGREVAIGGFAMGSGFILNRWFRYDTYNLKKGARLRIIDTRFKV